MFITDIKSIIYFGLFFFKGTISLKGAGFKKKKFYSAYLNKKKKLFLFFLSTPYSVICDQNTGLILL